MLRTQRQARLVVVLLLLLIPGINILVGVGIAVDFIKSYGKFRLRQISLGLVTFVGFILFADVGFR
jgi:signal peptidase I